MGLPGHHQFFQIKSQGICQDFQIFFHIFQGIAPAHRQIQTGLAAGAHAPQTGGKAVGNRNSLCRPIFQRTAANGLY